MKLFLGRNIVSIILVALMAFAGCEEGLDSGGDSESGFSFSDMYSRINALEKENKRLNDIIKSITGGSEVSIGSLSAKVAALEGYIGSVVAEPENSISARIQKIETNFGLLDDTPENTVISRINNMEKYVGNKNPALEGSLALRVQGIVDNIGSYKMSDFNTDINSLEKYVGAVVADPVKTISKRMEDIEGYVGDGEEDSDTAITTRVKNLEVTVGDDSSGMAYKLNYLHDELFVGVSKLTDPNTGQPTIQFSGVNVQIVSGAGYTKGGDGDYYTEGTVNGLGNLIVGYNEKIPWSGPTHDRTGSHNIIVGNWHNYSSYGGLVVGQGNTISGEFSSVSGGEDNTAIGDHSSVSGGDHNTAGGSFSSVSGGSLNRASGYECSVSGGTRNTAYGDCSSVSGGFDRSLTTMYTWRAGDYFWSDYDRWEESLRDK
ncbi:MAG: hypothetical protein GY754_38470 [bacterium]|nr:hypothetical protein [bacterium]